MCGKKLSSKGSLRLHKWKKHKEKVQFSCDLCGDKFDFQKEVIKHRNSTHRQEDGRFSCGMCSKRFIEYHSLSIHLKNHHNKQQETEGSNKSCTDCHESFDSEEGKFMEILHYIFHEITGKTCVPCTVFSFFYNSYLKSIVLF